MTRKTEIEIGFNVRHWMTMEIDDLAADEALILRNDDEDSVDLLKRLDKVGRITYLNEDIDDMPVMFGTDYTETSVISVGGDLS